MTNWSLDGGPLEGPVDCPTASCETDEQCARQQLYEDVSVVLRRSCGSARCHGILPAYDLMDLGLDPCDQRADMIDVPAAEYDRMARIAPGDPDNSWLMVKLTAPYNQNDQRIEFTPEAGFEPPDSFPLDAIGFGKHMPPPIYPITDDEIELFRRWIEAGAPGPLG